MLIDGVLNEVWPESNWRLAENSRRVGSFHDHADAALGDAVDIVVVRWTFGRVQKRVGAKNIEASGLEGTFVVANLYHASTDPAAWGNDAHDFKPGRPADKYLNWNGPFGGDAPRQCPGEHLSLEMGKALVDAWVEAKAPPLEA